MSKSNGRGGPRDGAGRKKKTETDRERIQTWYNLVCHGFEQQKTPNVSNVWYAIKAEMESFGSDAEFGSKTAWYAYAKGDRYPHNSFASNIDMCIVARNNHPKHMDKPLIKHPFRWVLERPGKLKLTPVWGWSPFRCNGVFKEEISFAAKVHAKFFERIPPETVFPFLQETVLSVQEDLDRPHDYKWPPILLLPKILANSHATFHPDLPLPYLMEEPLEEDCPHFDYEENFRKFAEWSLSTAAKASPGLVWFHEIPNYLKLIYNGDDVRFISPFSAGVLNSSVRLGEILEYAGSISPSFADQCLSRVLGISKQLNEFDT